MPEKLEPAVRRKFHIRHGALMPHLKINAGLSKPTQDGLSKARQSIKNKRARFGAGPCEPDGATGSRALKRWSQERPGDANRDHVEIRVRDVEHLVLGANAQAPDAELGADAVGEVGAVIATAADPR